jgi:subtilisin
LVGFNNPHTAEDEQLITDAGGDVVYRYHLVNAMAVSIPETALSGLSQNPNVSIIEPDGEVDILDAELDNAWGVKHIGAGTVHDLGIKGSGVKVAVVDTGIDYTHQDLDANYAGGADFVNGDNDPMDDHGHGTHVAGTIAAEDDGLGVVGVAPDAVLYGIKVLGATGSGSWSSVIAGLEWATDNGIQVTNNSYGAGSYPGTIVESAFDNSYAAGVLHIFSSTGVAVELSAPGVSINSTTIGGNYGTKSGTSMASPHVTGTAALVISSGAASGVVEVRDRLVSTASDLGAPGFDTSYWARRDSILAMGMGW